MPVFPLCRQDLVRKPRFAARSWRTLSARVALCGSVLLAAASSRAEEISALYNASWAGLPAGQIKLTLRDSDKGYRNEIAIRTEGLAALFTRFRGSAASEGALPPGRLPQPEHYSAFYDLRKSKNRRVSMRFVLRGAARVAERGPDDTSTKPPLAENFRQNVIDPLSVIAAVRHALRAGQGAFTLPVYDGSRRFDAIVRALPEAQPGDAERRVEMTLQPIAGFKGETSDDGDPDTAPRPVELAFSGDGRLTPLRMRVPVSYLPLVVEFARSCAAAPPCAW